MKNVIAIDIGGTKTLGALFSSAGELLEEKRIATNPKGGPEQLLKSLFDIVEYYVHKSAIGCISIGSAGRININEGSVFYASDNIPGWIGINLKREMEDRYHILTIVENDCKVAGIGEEWQGSAKGYKSYVCLALGTGVGAAVKIDGVLLHGAHWSAGELGHMILHPNGRQCNCGLKGCVEQYCSGPSLVKRYIELGGDSSIKTGYEYFEKLSEHDPMAIETIHEFVSDLAITIISLANIYDPDVFVIGGGLIDTRKYWWDDLIAEVNESSLSDMHEIMVKPAKLGNRAGIYGAAYLGIQKL